jgi:hypothetical protein
VEVEVEEHTVVNLESEGRNMVNFYQTTPVYRVFHNVLQDYKNLL